MAEPIMPHLNSWEFWSTLSRPRRKFSSMLTSEGNQANYKLGLLGPSSRALRLDPIPIWTNHRLHLTIKSQCSHQPHQGTPLLIQQGAVLHLLLQVHQVLVPHHHLHGDLKRLMTSVKTDDAQANPRFRALRLGFRLSPYNPSFISPDRAMESSATPILLSTTSSSRPTSTPSWTSSRVR